MYSKFRAEEVNSCSSSIANLEERYEGLIVSRVKAGWLCTIARTKSSCSGLSKEKFNSTNNLYSSGGTISSAEDVLVRTFLKFGAPCSSILPMQWLLSVENVFPLYQWLTGQSLLSQVQVTPWSILGC